MASAYWNLNSEYRSEMNRWVCTYFSTKYSYVWLYNFNTAEFCENVSSVLFYIFFLSLSIFVTFANF